MNNKPTNKELYQEYIVNRKSTIKLAKHYNVSYTTINAWLKEYKIPNRTWQSIESKKYIHKPRSKKSRNE